jgi:hypothetical protein
MVARTCSSFSFRSACVLQKDDGRKTAEKEVVLELEVSKAFVYERGGGREGERERERGGGGKEGRRKRERE